MHRAELVKQNREHARALRLPAPRDRARPHRPRQCQAEQFRAYGRSYVNASARVFVASVQTLVRRLDAIPPDLSPDIIVIDEAHHLTVGTMWGAVVDAFPRAKLLPVTATPCRLDGKGLGLAAGGFCDSLVLGPTMRRLIEAGSLSPYRIFAPPDALDLSGVKTRAATTRKTSSRAPSTNR